MAGRLRWPFDGLGDHVLLAAAVWVIMGLLGVITHTVVLRGHAGALLRRLEGLRLSVCIAARRLTLVFASGAQC
jgi:hypothetical protein